MNVLEHTMLGIDRILNPRQHESTHRHVSGASLRSSVAVLEADTSGESCRESSPTMEEIAARRGDDESACARLAHVTGSDSPTSAATVCKSLSQDKNEVSPTAGIGTADAGTPIVRYWTVKFERGGRTHFDAVEACDVLKATLVVFKRHEGANGVQVVREIQRDEFEHLTRSSP